MICTKVQSVFQREISESSPPRCGKGYQREEFLSEPLNGRHIVTQWQSRKTQDKAFLRGKGLYKLLRET